MKQGIMLHDRLGVDDVPYMVNGLNVCGAISVAHDQGLPRFGRQIKIWKKNSGDFATQMKFMI